jgi:hypothetical protein
MKRLRILAEGPPPFLRAFNNPGSSRGIWLARAIFRNA